MKYIPRNMPTRKPDDLPNSGKLLCIDAGEKTLGLALSNKGRLVANPLSTISRTKWGKDKLRLLEIIEKEGVVALVLGLPLTMSGEESPQTRKCITLAGQMEHDLNLPVLLWDERLSTKSATDALFEQRQGRQKRASKKDVKQQVDSVAAALILQNVLDALRSR